MLRHLPASDIERLAGAAHVRRFRKDALLFEEGNQPDCLFVLLDGLVELFAAGGKKEATVLIMLPRSIFLPAAALSNEPYLLTARALTEVMSIALDADAVRTEVTRSPALAAAFTDLLAAQFRLLVRQVRDQKLRTAAQRLCAFLSRVLGESGTNGYADLPIPKAILASRLGMTPESLSRALHVVERNGITVRGSRIILMNRDQVKRFCDLDPLLDGPDQRLRANHL